MSFAGERFAAADRQPEDAQSGSGARGVTRRHFLIGLGGASVASIAGYFVLGPGNSPSGASAKTLAREEIHPRLREGTVVGREGDLTTLTRPADPDSVSCAVNPTGFAVIQRLDGRLGVEGIAKGVAEELGIGCDEHMEAQIALFIAQVAMVGLLESPFYAQIVERTEVS